MARSHCTGTGQGTMDFHIMLCTVHITQGQGPRTGTGMGTNGLHTYSPPVPVPGLVLGPVLSNRFCCTLSHSWSCYLCCNVNRTPRSLSRSRFRFLSRSRAVWMSLKSQPVVSINCSLITPRYQMTTNNSIESSSGRCMCQFHCFNLKKIVIVRCRTKHLFKNFKSGKISYRY